VDKTFPRIELPGVTEDQRSEVENLMHKSKQARAFTLRYAVAMSVLGKAVYHGTVPADVKARRRAANKVARQSRRVNRGSK
jgi:hypothetical protein